MPAFGNLFPFLAGRGARKAKRAARRAALAELRPVRIGDRTYLVRPYKRRRKR